MRGTYDLFLFLVPIFETLLDNRGKLSTEIGSGTSSFHGKPGDESLKFCQFDISLGMPFEGSSYGNRMFDVIDKVSAHIADIVRVRVTMSPRQ